MNASRCRSSGSRGAPPGSPAQSAPRGCVHRAQGAASPARGGTGGGTPHRAGGAAGPRTSLGDWIAKVGDARVATLLGQP